MPQVMPSADAVGPTQRVPVWDVPVRLVHWLVVALLGFSWWSGKHHAIEWHRRSGYAIMTLLLFRFYWGIVGGRTARFTQFVRGPRAAFAYGRSLMRRRPEATDGHNPIGGWSAIAMLLTLSTMVVTGLFSVDIDGIESGPLAEHISFEAGRSAAVLHQIAFYVLTAVVSIHVAAITFYRVAFAHDLLRPMISGQRRAGATQAQPLGASGKRAAPGVVIALICTYAIARRYL